MTDGRRAPVGAESGRAGRADFRRLGRHLAGQEIDFDDVRPQAVDANLLSIQVRHLVELRVPLANKLIHSLWLASRAPARGDVTALAVAGKRGRYFVPVEAFQPMRMQSNPFLEWARPGSSCCNGSG